MRELAKNCAIAWSILCAGWALFGFLAGATGTGSTAATATCCGSMSTLTAVVAWIVGLIPCALFAVIGGPAAPPPLPPPPTAETVEAPNPAGQKAPQFDVTEEVLVWILVAAIVAGSVYLGYRASAPQ